MTGLSLIAMFDFGATSDKFPLGGRVTVAVETGLRLGRPGPDIIVYHDFEFLSIAFDELPQFTHKDRLLQVYDIQFTQLRRSGID